MTTITFDTLKFTKKLESAGFPQQQAEAVAEAFKEASGEAEIATKHDLDLLRAEIMGELKLNRWMLGILLGGVLSLILKAYF